MTQIETADGPIETTLPEDKVADLKVTPVAEPTPEPKAEEKQPEKTEEPAKEPEAVADPQPQAQERPKKAGPIADLLEKKHEAEQKAAQAEAKVAELEAQLAKLSTQAPTAQTDDKITALATKHGLDPEVLADIVSAAREGISPGLPKEVQELLQERQAEKQQKEELTIFNKRVDSLSTTLKDDLLKDPKVREKLQELAYSTDKAPDGEPFYQKEIAELYFGFVKPEFEVGSSRVDLQACKLEYSIVSPK